MSDAISNRFFRYLRGILPDRFAVFLDYYRIFRSLPNIRSPKTLNEKIAWRKLYQHNPLFTLYSDKIAVKKEVAELIGAEHVIETLWAGCSPERIPFDDINPPYVIKVNHSSGGNIFVRSDRDVDRQGIIASVNRQLSISHGNKAYEWGYLNIPRKVMVERMLVLPGQEVPDDYKFFIYHGKARFIHVDVDRFTRHARNLYDRDWNRLEGQYEYPNADREIARPHSLEKMISIAEAIGARFDFVRVDLYLASGQIYFGEATFYPAAGLGEFFPRELDYKFGEPWKTARR